MVKDTQTISFWPREIFTSIQNLSNFHFIILSPRSQVSWSLSDSRKVVKAYMQDFLWLVKTSMAQIKHLPWLTVGNIFTAPATHHITLLSSIANQTLTNCTVVTRDSNALKLRHAVDQLADCKCSNESLATFVEESIGERKFSQFHSLKN